MKTEEASKQIIFWIEALLLIAERALAVIKNLRLLRPRPAPYSYENILLDFRLELKDKDGRRAVVTRKQRVHFLTNEAGVLSSPVWGEGSQLERLQVTGARRLGERPDGSRRVLLLGLKRRAVRDQQVTVVSKQTLADSFLTKQEYMEAVAERPTRRLSLCALFPKGRPPVDAYLSSNTGREEKLPVRLGADGRARLSWSVAKPALDTVYSMRWAW